MDVYDGDTARDTCTDCHKEDWLEWNGTRKAPLTNTPPSPCTGGYHLREIPQGTPGELSKVLEEVHECLDAEAQNNPIMVLTELSDLYGAIEMYLEKHHPTFNMHHLANMSEATHRAFKVGRRKRK